MQEQKYTTDDAKKMSDLIRGHKATFTGNIINRVKISFYIFEENYKNTLKWLQILDNQEFVIALNSNKDDRKLNAFLDETARHLHNYLASAKALIDHSRNMVKDLYKGESFYEEYDQKVKVLFEKNTLRSFIQDLRNYNLHKYAPILIAQFSIAKQNADLKVMIGIDGKALMEWDGWTQNAKAYISKFEKLIPLKEFMNEYFIIIEEFYTWLAEHQNNLHKDDMKELLEVVIRYNAMLKELENAKL